MPDFPHPFVHAAIKRQLATSKVAVVIHNLSRNTTGKLNHGVPLDASSSFTLATTANASAT